MKRPIGLGLKFLNYNAVSGPHVNSPSGISNGRYSVEPIVWTTSKNGIESKILNKKLTSEYLDYWEGVTTKTFKCELYKNIHNNNYVTLLTQTTHKHYAYKSDFQYLLQIKKN